MAKKAEYCKCLDTYTINKCDKKRCKTHPIWKQGVGNIGGKKSND
tara:strand:+ start:148 stop:282 length:135 start_codon:yes stop_codon:yes gene_type:complete